MKCKNIKNFTFKNANYHLSDDMGNSLIAMVNYEEERFELSILKKKNKGIEKLKNEASKIAQDLIKRKSKVNFAKRN